MKRIIVSGYFNPLHVGHLEMMENARKLGDWLIVIVNNDAQQLLKKEMIIIPEQDRIRIVRALRIADEVVLSADTDRTVRETIRQIAERYAGDELVFANGGDRDSAKAVPETEVCENFGIDMIFKIAPQLDSSTRITSAMSK